VSQEVLAQGRQTYLRIALLVAKPSKTKDGNCCVLFMMNYFLNSMVFSQL
jgi:hypothetical protein